MTHNPDTTLNLEYFSEALSMQANDHTSINALTNVNSLW